jgi:hypothetical protein
MPSSGSSGRLFDRRGRAGRLAFFAAPLAFLSAATVNVTH